MRDLFEAIGVGIIVTIIGIGVAVSVLFALGFIFKLLSKALPEKKCAIELYDGSKVQSANCDIYRYSTSLDCAGINFSMYAVKSWRCK